MIYSKVDIGELVTLRQGFAINKKTSHHMSEEPTALHLLRIGDMKDGSFSMYVKDTIPEKFIAKENDIIYTRTGQVGLVFRKQHGVVHNNCFTVSTNDKSVLDQEFLYYVLQEKSFYEEAISKATGAAQPDLPHGAFNSIQIFLPPIESQKEITRILNAYNDLIANNQKQIKLLEESAQRLYKEWFVDLRFPGHEDVAIVDGVPEGWRKDRLGNCVVVKRGGSPRPIQDYLTDKGLNWLKISDATSANGYYILDIKEHIIEAGLNKTVMLKKGSLVLSNSATPGIPKILDVDSCIHDGWLYFSESYFTNEFLFLLFLQERANLIALGTGAVFTNLKTDIVKNYSIIVPNKDVLDEFQKRIEPIFVAIKNKQNTIKKLSEARDRLQSKLMSGEIEV